jgi:APA family basic amino acid/polyamine antiporter
MAREGLFFRSCGTLHATRGTPTMALLFQGVWSCVLALTGSYDALLTYITFASVLFGALTVVGVFVLRRTQPDRPRPYRCWGYPVTPALYLAIALYFLVYVIQADLKSTGIGLLLIATGIPVYLWWRRDAAPVPPEQGPHVLPTLPESAQAHFSPERQRQDSGAVRPADDGTREAD